MGALDSLCQGKDVSDNTTIFVDNYSFWKSGWMYREYSRTKTKKQAKAKANKLNKGHIIMKKTTT